MESRQAIGKWGEQVAVEYLAGRGVNILARNVRTPYGEIDIIGQCEGALVFVEVKTRTTTRLGMPETAVTEQKAAHLQDAAEHYLQQNPEAGENWRIDVVAVLGRPGDRKPQIEWFEDVVA